MGLRPWEMSYARVGGKEKGMDNCCETSMSRIPFCGRRLGFIGFLPWYIKQRRVKQAIGLQLQKEKKNQKKSK
jgi:hypothetical protein